MSDWAPKGKGARRLASRSIAGQMVSDGRAGVVGFPAGMPPANDEVIAAWRAGEFDADMTDAEKAGRDRVRDHLGLPDKGDD